MEKQQLLALIAAVVPRWAREAVPHAIKEPIVNAFSRERAPAAHALEQAWLPRGRYDAMWNAAFAARADRGYFDTHRERYHELFNALAHYHPDFDEAFDLLEVGVSEFAGFYKQLYPNLRLATLDRPVSLQGADAAWSRRLAHAERHYNADLNAEALHPAWGDPPIGQFDYIVCTEVIEHLVRHPGEFLGELVSLLKPAGLLYLTTPNFLRRENLDKIARRENPQAVYPRRGDNWDAHHHFREMTMGELRRFIVEAGGREVASYFSGCWDDAAVRAGDPQLRGNLVAVIGRGAR